MPADRTTAAPLMIMLMLSGCGPKAPPVSSGEAVARTAPNAAAAQAILETASTSLDVTTRRYALVALMEQDPDPSGGSWAERGLWDPEPAVQRAVVSALAERLPEPGSAARLQDFVGRENLTAYPRCQAASALARSGDQSTLSAVQAAMSEAPAPWLAAPCALAAAQMGDEAALSVLNDSLREGGLPLDTGFMRDLGRSGLTGTVPALREGLALMEEELRLAVATALLELGEAEGATMLRRALGGNDPVAQLEAVDFLLTSSSEQATVLLRRAGGGDVGVAAQLALIGRGEELPYFAVESLLSADREVRALACEVLGLWLEGADSPPRRAERLAHEALLKSLEDLEEQVRLEAIRALGRSGRAADASALAPLVMSEEPGWQGVVASAALLKLVSGTR